MKFLTENDKTKSKSKTVHGWQGLLFAALLAVLASLPAVAQTGKAAVSCESLAKLSLPNTTIVEARMLAPGEFQFPPHPPGSGGYPPNMDEAKIMPAFCMVLATLTPTSDSHINFEVWLPPSGWNGKLLGVGNGGWGGRISHAGMITGVLNGYVGASCDSGHDVLDGDGGAGFLDGHPEKLVDFAYRAEHEMTVKAKAIIATYYGSGPKHSYFVGSRMGGYQGLAEARRYPADYDGIVAESPQTSMALSTIAQLWPHWLALQNPAGVISAAKFAVVHQAVLDQCDALDGVKDGTLENPLACSFDPAVLLCQGADAPGCLTAPQLELLRQLYAGPANARTKEKIFPGPALGAETGEVAASVSSELRAGSTDLFRYVVFKDAKWDWKTMNWDADTEKAIAATASLLTVDANLKEFADRGGKLLMYTAWGSSQNPVQLIDYANAAAKSMGTAKAASSLRLIAIPGEFREAPFEKLKVMEQWMEQGKAPDQIVGSYYADGKLARTRLLCASPKVAQYKGAGDTNQAGNFVCAAGKATGKK